MVARGTTRNRIVDMLSHAKEDGLASGVIAERMGIQPCTVAWHMDALKKESKVYLTGSGLQARWRLNGHME
jgi:predicted ArsR family transcriptional regulator